MREVRVLWTGPGSMQPMGDTSPEGQRKAKVNGAVWNSLTRFLDLSAYRYQGAEWGEDGLRKATVAEANGKPFDIAICFTPYPDDAMIPILRGLVRHCLVFPPDIDHFKLEEELNKFFLEAMFKGLGLQDDPEEFRTGRM